MKPLFEAHELGITRKTTDGYEVHLVIDRARARYFGRPLSDAAYGSTAHRKFENIVKLSYAPLKVHIHYELSR